jgi:hypothetical protein
MAGVESYQCRQDDKVNFTEASCQFVLEDWFRNCPPSCPASAQTDAANTPHSFQYSNNVANTHTVVSDVYQGVTNIRTIASEPQDTITNSHTIVSTSVVS